MSNVEVDQVEVTAPAPAGRSRAWWIAGLLVAGIVMGAAAWFVAHEPLSVGGGGYGVSSQDTAAVTLSVPGQQRGSWLIAYEEGATVEIWFPLWNRGPLPLTVREIEPLGEGLTCGLHLTDVAYVPSRGPGMVRDHAQPIAPFRLDSGDYAQIWMSGRFADPCFLDYPAKDGGWSSQDHVPVRFSVLGIPRSADVDLGHSVVTSYVVDDPWLQVGD